MNISVTVEPTSTYIHDDWYDMTELREELEVWHLALRCRHDCVMVSLQDGVYCPDCENEHMTVGEVEAFAKAWAEEMCDPYGGDEQDD